MCLAVPVKVLEVKNTTATVELGGIATDPFGNVRAGFEGAGEISRKQFGLTWNVALEAGGVLVSDNGVAHASATRGEPPKHDTSYAGIRSDDSDFKLVDPTFMNARNEFGDDIQLQILTVFPGFVLQQINQARTQGMEAAFNWQPCDRFHDLGEGFLQLSARFGRSTFELKNEEAVVSGCDCVTDCRFCFAIKFEKR